MYLKLACFIFSTVATKHRLILSLMHSLSCTYREYHMHMPVQKYPSQPWEHRAHCGLIYPFTQYLYSMFLWQQSRHMHSSISHLYVSPTTHTRAFTANKLSLCLKIISLTNRVISCTLVKILGLRPHLHNIVQNVQWKHTFLFCLIWKLVRQYNYYWFVKGLWRWHFNVKLTSENSCCTTASWPVPVSIETVMAVKAGK